MIFKPKDKRELQCVVDKWFDVREMRNVFEKYGNICTWDVSLITDMSGLFAGKLFNEDIRLWNVSNVVNMSRMFHGTTFVGWANCVNNDYFESWDVSNVKDMSFMFAESNYRGILNEWTTSSLENIESIFENSSFSGFVCDWDVSNVTNFKNAFRGSKFVLNGHNIFGDRTNVTFGHLGIEHIHEEYEEAGDYSEEEPAERIKWTPEELSQKTEADLYEYRGGDSMYQW